MSIPFNKATASAWQQPAMEEVFQSGRLAGGGKYTRICEAWLRTILSAPGALLTTSCSSALEMAVLLAGIRPGDEVIMSSFTFPSMANAVALRGGIPEFVDILAGTLNLDETLIEPAISSSTKALMPMHYGGIACAMDTICDIAERHQLMVIEDAAHSLLARRSGRLLGSIGQLGAFSFHETKTIGCGEGGALIINDPQLLESAEIIREKGTNRAAFLRGDVQRYRWVDIGSSYLPSELQAAWLSVQLMRAESVIEARKKLWYFYHDALTQIDDAGLARRPGVPNGCDHSAHIYYLILPSPCRRDALISFLNSRGIGSAFHFQPLHSAPVGLAYGRAAGPLPMTEKAASCLIRLPLWEGLETYQAFIIDTLHEFFHGKTSSEH